MAWLKLEDTFYDHPKVRKLARRLTVNRAQAAGHLALLWSWALRHAPDGDLSQIDFEDIEEAAQWGGAHGDFVKACFDCAFLDQNGDQIAIHNWITRGGSFAENKRKQRNRDARKSQDETVPGLSRDSDGTATRLSRPRVEKSRVEYRSDKRADDIQEVWQHYRTHHPGTAKRLTSGRKEYQLIKARLEDFDADQLKASIDGFHKSPWHTGQNPDGKRYLSLALMMRDISHVQSGLEMLTARPSDNGRPRTLDPTEALGDTRD